MRNRGLLSLIKVLTELVFIGAIAVTLYALVDIISTKFTSIPSYVFQIAKSIIIIGAGVAGTRALGNYIVSALSPRVKEKAYSVANAFKFLGYIASIIAGLLVIHVASAAALFGGTVTGLVLGLALQPILSNLFAGILVIASGLVRVGDEVTLVNWQLPYSPSTLPSYKFFSADYPSPGFRGRVVEVNLFYTVIILDIGKEMRVPNNILLQGGVVSERSEWSQKRIINVRAELPLSVVDVGSLEERIRGLLQDLGVIAVYLNEQSDKDYVIVLARLAVPSGTDWRAVKSEALKRLLKLREELIKANEQRFLCLTKGVCR
ncbi:MAG: mechanosensitive ion channel family protein [Thermoproteus sp. AZ2]|jgi:small-conductance mechanosensitive channel|uniref:Mechanosensitive ion channel family protein n=1 Tax=Thermoproteus sp. AZ2 TaxID=1609232 RepID=A0ACC6V0Y2_9CREN|nr:MAG: mechanosensitive ion channel protein MscS [Thermoproteus sp. AZ2]